MDPLAAVFIYIFVFQREARGKENTKSQWEANVS